MIKILIKNNIYMVNNLLKNMQNRDEEIFDILINVESNIKSTTKI